MNIEEAIVRLDDSIRRLKVQQDMFLVGSLKRPPNDLRREVEQIIQRFTNTKIRSYAHRFQLNALVSKYHALNQLWLKQIRQREEGGRSGLPLPAGARGEPPAIGAPPPRDDPPAQDELFRICVSDPEAEADAMRTLYDRYMAARATAAPGARKIKLESFLKQVIQQATDLRASTDCEGVEFRVLKNGGTIALKARATGLEAKS